MNRSEVLIEVDKVINGERKVAYGTPENNFQNIANLWSAFLGYEITALQVCLMMDLMKTGRLMTNPTHPDSIFDKVGYSAIYMELATDANK